MNKKIILIIISMLIPTFLAGCANNRMSIYEITQDNGKEVTKSIISYNLDASGDTLTIFEANSDPAKYKRISASSSNQTLLNNIKQSVVQAAQLAKIFLTVP